MRVPMTERLIRPSVFIAVAAVATAVGAQTVAPPGGQNPAGPAASTMPSTAGAQRAPGGAASDVAPGGAAGKSGAKDMGQAGDRQTMRQGERKGAVPPSGPAVNQGRNSAETYDYPASAPKSRP